MKKTLLLSLILVFLVSINGFATQTNTLHLTTSSAQIKKNEDGLFKTIKKSIKSKIKETKATVQKLKILKNKYAGGIGLKTSILLMVIGLIFMIIAGAIGDHGIVWAVGAIFFLIGAIFLLLSLI